MEGKGLDSSMFKYYKRTVSTIWPTFLTWYTEPFFFIYMAFHTKLKCNMQILSTFQEGRCELTYSVTQIRDKQQIDVI